MKMIQIANNFIGLKDFGMNASIAFYSFIAFVISAIAAKALIEFRLHSSSPWKDALVTIAAEIGAVVSSIATFAVMISHFLIAVR